MIKLAINGYGRIGRCIVRALYESGRTDTIKVVGINELSDIRSIAHLTRFDSTHGRFCRNIDHDGNHLLIDGDRIAVSSQQDISRLRWNDLDVDIVLECSGSFTDRTIAEQHLTSGAGKVIFSCPAQADVDATIVYGLNHHTLSPQHTIISNASCTTNCISHIIKTINDHCTISAGVITTVHSMMNDQPVIDAYHNPDLRKSRSSSNSIIPVNTELARGIERVFPELGGKFSATALRVPTLNVSTMQLTAQVEKETTAEQINHLFKEAAARMPEILGYTELPLVSCDFNHDSRSAIVDASQTSASGTNLVNVLAWFDNEWGYANRMIDTASALMSV
ncbi:MAG: glyceraldehyde 3-phosphate dehydrogenase NAD-binding domain-containing protein [Desulfocapsaceae bacterium]|jgi:erythrose-4-phosphate dehydrogenase|nr:glyceraldehyde 3-phosphate dehydrogenase NAD-binding domain-containing protein [Desulfocapsaceae bacterium]